jgi:hypothetical protein
VNQRVPKKLLLENGAPTAADKRLINEGIEELLWLAALKPTTIGVPEYRDEVREYLEIASCTSPCGRAAKERVWWSWCIGPCPIHALKEAGKTALVDGRVHPA